MATVARGSDPVVTEITGWASPARPASPPSSPASCSLGIEGPAAVGAVNFFPLEYEEFRLAFDPSASCAACLAGFEVSVIHVVMQVTDPCSLTISANLATLDASTNPECPRPDGVLCQGPAHSVVLPGPGTWDIALPLDCACAAMNASYTLGIQILALSCWPILMTDGDPTICRNWDNIGWGWSDLPGSDSEWPGDLVFYADASCCGSTGVVGHATAAERPLRVFPNPASSDVTVSFTLDSSATVDLGVFDVSGRRVATLHRGSLAGGTFQFAWVRSKAQANRLPAGTYFVRLEEGGRARTAKIVLNR